MRIESKDSWIDIKGLEQSRTYFFRGFPPMVVDHPEKLMVHSTGAHTLITSQGGRIEVPADWFAFTADGEFGVHVGGPGEEVPLWEPVDSEVQALDFQISPETTFRVRNPVKVMNNASGSVKIQQEGGQIAYIRRGWQKKRVLSK